MKLLLLLIIPVFAWFVTKINVGDNPLLQFLLYFLFTMSYDIYYKYRISLVAEALEKQKKEE